MKTASSLMIDFLAANDFWYEADLFTFTLTNGQVFYWTSADRDVKYGGHTFSSKGPRLDRSSIRAQLGMQVDSMEIKVGYDATVLYGGVAFPQALTRGDFRQATVKLERAIMPTWGDMSLGTVVMFLGRCGPAKSVTRIGCTLVVNSMVELLNINLPLHVLQPGCRWTLFDAGCTLSASAFKVSATADSGSTSQTVLSAALTQADTYFTQGKIKFTSGQNAGFWRHIDAYTVGSVSVIPPLPYTPAISDAFDIYPGCDKQQTTCDVKFSNLINFGGQPYVPQPETAI